MKNAEPKRDPSGSIPRVRGLPPVIFERDFVRRGRPVVMEGLVQNWAGGDWNFESWARRWPDRHVNVEERPLGDPFDIAGTRSKRMSLLDFVQRVADDNPEPSQALPFLYIKPQREFSELLTHAPPPTFLSNRKLEWTLLGGRDPIIPAHYHSSTQVLLCQIVGKKRVLMYRPADTSRLYPHPVHSNHYSVSRVNFVTPDFRKFPKLSAARCIEVLLEPGDAMFIPVHWWHTSFGIGRSVAITLAWDARLREYRFPQPGLRTVVASALLKARGRLRSAMQRIPSKSVRGHARDL